MGLGFILLKNHKKGPKVVQLLSEIYNLHVRFGAAMALDISCAALELLEPLTKDVTDYVRQGAFIAAAMILIQGNDANAHVVSYQMFFNRVTFIYFLNSRV